MVTESFKDSSHSRLWVWYGKAVQQRGVEVVIGDKTLKILIMNMLFALNILRMAIFQWFSTHIHCNVDLGLSVVKEMG